ncbi:MAG: argininosuccinate lyase [Acidobacteria bacterium]|nr:argininosuccinate lyase [Acidobacteriota bacterium]
MKLWGGRFEKGPSEVFERFSGSLHYDRRLLAADVQGSQAFARELERAGILTAAEREQICAALGEIAAEPADPTASDEDIHTLVIRRLKEKIGAPADKIHTGRSRNEQVSLDFRLCIRETIRALRLRLADLMEALLESAARDGEVVLPGYTHTRRAQPVLWGHYLLAHFEMLGRDATRFEQAYRTADLSPLGSGALAGSGFPFDRERMARDLGFSGITRNSLDAAGDRDFALDFLYAAAMTMLHLSRLAEDWILYSGEEFGFLELGDEVTSGSSLMPQKKNPDSLELIRGKTGRVAGCLQALLITMKGLPLTYNRDMQEDKEAVFEAADQTEASLEMAAVVMRSARLNRARSEAAAEQSWTQATELAEALASRGVDARRAHELVGRLVLESQRLGRQPRDWTPEALTAFAPEFDATMAELLDARRAVENHAVPGGTAPSMVRQALDEARRRLEQLRAARL